MTERDRFESWYFERFRVQIGFWDGYKDNVFELWQACAAQYEAQLKVAEDALKYYAKQTNAGYGFVAREALSKMRGMQ